LLDRRTDNTNDLSLLAALTRRSIQWTPASRWLAGTLLLILLSFASTYALFLALSHGDVDMNYQGDQGTRLYEAVHDALNGWQGFFDRQREYFFGFHPPGDYILKFIAWKLRLLVDPLAADPVGFNLAIGFVAGGVTLLALGLAARRVSGIPGGVLTIAALSASFVFNDVRTSTQGEVFYYPLFATSFYFLVRALDPHGKHQRRDLIVSAVLALLSSFFRSELIFLLPGVCLALWCLVGFGRAFVYGLVASAFAVAQMAYPYIVDKQTLTMFNAHSYYHTPERTLLDLFRTPFMLSLLSDPAGWFVLLGTVCTVVFAFARGGRRDHDWRTVVTLGGAALTYVVIISTAIVNELTTHNSYRLAMAPVHLFIPVFAISAVQLFRRTFAETGIGRRDTASRLRPTAVAAGLFIGATGILAFTYLGPQMAALKTRGLPGRAEAIDFVLGRLKSDETVYIDRMHYWESLLPGYFAHRKPPLCTYARCNEPMTATQAAWGAVRKDPALAGTKTWGEFAALRSHVFIRDFRPAYIIMPNEPLYLQWLAEAKRIWPTEWVLWLSHLEPYLAEPINFKQPQKGLFLHLGTVEGREYFDEYVYLVPRIRTAGLIVFQAYYGRRP